MSRISCDGGCGFDFFLLAEYDDIFDVLDSSDEEWRETLDDLCTLQNGIRIFLKPGLSSLIPTKDENFIQEKRQGRVHTIDFLSSIIIRVESDALLLEDGDSGEKLSHICRNSVASVDEIAATSDCFLDRLVFFVEVILDIVDDFPGLVDMNGNSEFFVNHSLNVG